jgi:WD40 repeat protein
MDQQQESPRFFLVLGSLFLFAYVAFNLGTAWMDAAEIGMIAAYTPTATLYQTPTVSPTSLPNLRITASVTPGGPIPTAVNTLNAAEGTSAPVDTPTDATAYPPPAEPTAAQATATAAATAIATATAIPVEIQPTATRTPRPSSTPASGAYPGPDEPDPYPGPGETSTPRPTLTAAVVSPTQPTQTTPTLVTTDSPKPTEEPAEPNNRKIPEETIYSLDFLEMQVIANGSVDQAIWAQAGTTLVLATSKGIYFYDFYELEKLGSMEIGPVTSVAYSANDEVIIVGASDASITGWNISDRRFTGSWMGHLLGIVRVYFSEAGNFLASGSDDATIRIWDAAGNLFFTLSEPIARVSDMAVSNNGRLVAASSNQHVHIWNPVNGDLLKTIHQPVGWYNAVAFSPDSSTLVTAYEDRRLEFWNTTTWARSKVIPQTQQIELLAYSSDGSMLAAAYQDGRIRIWDPQSRALLVDLAGHPEITSLIFNSLANKLVTTSRDGTIRVWDLAPLWAVE